MPPNIAHVVSYFKTKNLDEAEAKLFFDHYSKWDWKDKNGTVIKNWKTEANDWISVKRMFQQFIGKCLSNGQKGRKR